jgi:hypothetical protein
MEQNPIEKMGVIPDTRICGMCKRKAECRVFHKNVKECVNLLLNPAIELDSIQMTDYVRISCYDCYDRYISHEGGFEMAELNMNLA